MYDLALASCILHLASPALVPPCPRFLAPLMPQGPSLFRTLTSPGSSLYNGFLLIITDSFPSLPLLLKHPFQSQPTAFPCPVFFKALLSIWNDLVCLFTVSPARMLAPWRHQTLSLALWVQGQGLMIILDEKCFHFFSDRKETWIQFSLDNIQVRVIIIICLLVCCLSSSACGLPNTHSTR